MFPTDFPSVQFFNAASFKLYLNRGNSKNHFQSNLKMRENQLSTCSFDTMALSKTPKSSLVSVSSNVYYGYQPLPVQSQDEPMQTEPCVDLPLTQQFTGFCRKRCRTADERPLKNWKRHRQNGNISFQGIII